jgi:hypothetical protein
LIDGFAALISVPTQVYIVSKYGEVILDKLAEFKMIVLSIAGVLFVVWLVKKVYQKNVRINS